MQGKQPFVSFSKLRCYHLTCDAPVNRRLQVKWKAGARGGRTLHWALKRGAKWIMEGRVVGNDQSPHFSDRECAFLLDQYPCQGIRSAGDGMVGSFRVRRAVPLLFPLSERARRSEFHLRAVARSLSCLSRLPSVLLAFSCHGITFVLCIFTSSLFSPSGKPWLVRSLSFVALQSHPTIVGHQFGCSPRERENANQTREYIIAAQLNPFLVLSIRILGAQSSRSLLCFFSRQFLSHSKRNLVLPTPCTLAFRPSLLHKTTCQPGYCFFIQVAVPKQPNTWGFPPNLRRA